MDVEEWLLNNLRIHAETDPVPLFSIKMPGVVTTIPCAIPMTNEEIGSDGIARVGGNFDCYLDTWRIVCVKTIKKENIVLIALIDGSGDNATELKRRSYERGFDWDMWIGLKHAQREGEVDGYYVFRHEKRIGRYLGFTWAEALQTLEKMTDD